MDFLLVLDRPIGRDDCLGNHLSAKNPFARGRFERGKCELVCRIGGQVEGPEQSADQLFRRHRSALGQGGRQAPLDLFIR